MKRKLLFFALGILCMAFSATAVFWVVDRDKTGPVIAVPEDGSLTYVAGEDKKILLEGVTASDSEDVEDAIADLPKESPRFRLSQHEVMLAVGEVFDYSQYISDITDDKDSREQLYGRIRLQGKVDTSKAGIYEISYFVVDSDKNQSNVEVLTVKVE